MKGMFDSEHDNFRRLAQISVDFPALLTHFQEVQALHSAHRKKSMRQHPFTTSCDSLTHSLTRCYSLFLACVVQLASASMIYDRSQVKQISASSTSTLTSS